MSIALFEHNQAAYNAVIEMLADTGKAAVVHPNSYKSEKGLRLYSWLNQQRIKYHAGKRNKSNISLEKLGFCRNYT